MEHFDAVVGKTIATGIDLVYKPDLHHLNSDDSIKQFQV